MGAGNAGIRDPPPSLPLRLRKSSGFENKSSFKTLPGNSTFSVPSVIWIFSPPNADEAKQMRPAAAIQADTRGPTDTLFLLGIDSDDSKPGTKATINEIGCL